MTAAIIISVIAMLVIAACDRLAEHTGLVAPIVLLFVGLGVGFFPGIPDITVDPDVVLAVVLPPLLYAAATSMPTMDFRRNLRAISGLSVVLVVLSAAVCGFIFEKMVPGLGLAAGIALGAIVSPTDAVATSIVRRQGVANRVVTVLEGEGLINDASALVIMASAVTAMSAHITPGQVIGRFFWAVIIALLIGWGAGELMVFVRTHLRSVTADTILALVTPYIAFIPAEELGASGLVAAVMAGLVVGREGTVRLHANYRVAARRTWAMVQLVLESGVFLLMGLQLPGILHDVAEGELGTPLAIGVAAAGLAAILVVRSIATALLVMASVNYNRELKKKQSRLEQIKKTVQVMGGGHHGDVARDILPPAIDKTLNQITEAPHQIETRAHKHEQGHRHHHENQQLAIQQGQSVIVPGDKADLTISKEGENLVVTSGNMTRTFSPERARKFRIRVARMISDMKYFREQSFGPREGAVIIWAGMRGAVTLAAAQTLPLDIPHRSFLILVASLLATASLVIQGSTLGLLVRLVKPAKPGIITTDERRQVYSLMRRAAQRVPAPPGHDPRSDTRFAPPRGHHKHEADAVDTSSPVERNENSAKALEVSTQRTEFERDDAILPGSDAFKYRLNVLTAQRKALLAVRDLGRYKPELLDEILMSLDADEISMEMHAGPVVVEQLRDEELREQRKHRHQRREKHRAEHERQRMSHVKE